MVIHILFVLCVLVCLLFSCNILKVCLCILYLFLSRTKVSVTIVVYGHTHIVCFCVFWFVCCFYAISKKFVYVSCISSSLGRRFL